MYFHYAMYLLNILVRLFSMSKNPKKSFQRFAVSPNSQCICAFGSDKNCVVGEYMFVCTLLLLCGGKYICLVCIL